MSIRLLFFKKILCFPITKTLNVVFLIIRYKKLCYFSFNFFLQYHLAKFVFYFKNGVNKQKKKKPLSFHAIIVLIETLLMKFSAIDCITSLQAKPFSHWSSIINQPGDAHLEKSPWESCSLHSLATLITRNWKVRRRGNFVVAGHLASKIRIPPPPAWTRGSVLTTWLINN